ncbi:SDR family NAD(P)-dependent oxidoreductase [Streptomyces sp. SID8382]|uniref:SDR family NAD(P)-dependent oxidoreductase n=1 Tax=Streptomyces malaysiensis TaxID=92644 RepID=UPI000C2C5311|nr:MULTISPECIES: SDR family NAD(P)-dependent oxidoreductase [unclassified Streptomyces]AUA08023.1 putative oxidoreductase [Streptomyces sp. M56]MYX60720.1 SDR family NAD(P)-dependent oxidoreductase [Streptomyces sp. SID8382]
MTTTRPSRVLLTGSGTGIAALAAVSLAEAGHAVFASMRDPEGRNAAKDQALRDATKTAAGSLSVVELDVVSEESAQSAVTEIAEEAGGLDVVVHNAAHLLVGVTEAFSPEEVLRAFDVNAVGALRVNRAVLPVMRRQESGLLLWVGSGTTRAIPPFLGPYTAAKAAFDAFADSTAWDVAVYGIETTILMPGVFTQGTAHFANAAFPADTERTAAYDKIAPYLASMGEDTERLMVDGVSADPQIVADEIVRIVDLPEGRRPRRAVADGSDYGAEIVNGAAEELRLRLARRMGVTTLLQRA